MPTCILNNPSQSIINYKYKLINQKKQINTLKLVNEKYEIKGLLSSIKKDNEQIFLYTNLEDINSTSAVLKSQLIYLTLFMIILSAIIAFYISKKLTKPITNITKQARNLGKKETLNFEKCGILEIDELADALNYSKEEINKIDELRRDLMANVSHDLKTPLTMIKAYGEMLRDFSYKDEEKRLEHLNIIIDEADRLNVLVNDILLLSKSQAEIEKITKEKYDLVAEVKNIIKKYDIMTITEKYNIILKAPKKAIIKADKNKLNQVIYNLINNAINYTGKDKKVLVNIKSEKNKYVIEVIDTGKGIKEEEIPFIWDKYYKNEKNHQRNVIGTGLGLNIVKAILEQHKFKYGVESQKNKGTKFFVEINK